MQIGHARRSTHTRESRAAPHTDSAHPWSKRTFCEAIKYTIWPQLAYCVNVSSWRSRQQVVNRLGLQRTHKLCLHCLTFDFRYVLIVFAILTTKQFHYYYYYYYYCCCCWQLQGCNTLSQNGMNFGPQTASSWTVFLPTLCKFCIPLHCQTSQT